MKRDYPELEGKVINYVNSDFPKIKSALVVGVNFDIGVTLVNADDVNEYLYCSRGPLSPFWKRCEGTESEKMKLHKKAFTGAVKSIKAGKFSREAMCAVSKKAGGLLGPSRNPDASSCAFAA